MTPRRQPRSLVPDDLPLHELLRGRTAKTPLEIGWRGWVDITLRVFERIGIDHLGLVAAGVTFYVFLALLPAMIAVATSYGVITDSSTVQSHIDFLRGYLPDQSIRWIGREWARASEFGGQGLNFALVGSFAISLWAMNNAVIALFGAMNIAYGEIEQRSYVGLYLRSFTFTFAALFSGIVMVGAFVVLPLTLSVLGDVQLAFGGRLITAPVLFAIVTIGATAIYRIGPSRKPAKLRWIVPGAIIVALGWLAASTLLSWYLSNVANYTIVYGSLGTIVALMFWFYISVFILLMGAELNAEIEHQTAVDTTVGESAPLGSRGAYVADTLGKRSRFF